MVGIGLTAVAVSLVFAVPVAQAGITNGTIDSTFKYAWGSRIGWINFGTSGGNVHVTDTGLTGYAWSDNYGWINLAPTTSGVTMNAIGNLAGSAWGENTGWIAFSGVSINQDGEFIGNATGDVVGTISFNCANTSVCSSSNFKVITDWRPKTARPACSNGLDDDGDGKIDFPADAGCTWVDDTDESGGIGGGGGPGPGTLDPPRAPGSSSGNPAGGFLLLINGGAPITDQRRVTLTLTAGAEAAVMAVSNLADLRDAAQTPYQTTLAWDLCGLANGSISLSSCPEGIYTVSVRFYTKTGQPSSLVSASIRLRYALASVSPPAEAPSPPPPAVPPPSPPGPVGVVGPAPTPVVFPSPRATPGVAVPEPKSIFERIPDLFERIIPRFLLPQPPPVAPVEVPLEQLLAPVAPVSLRGEWDLVGGHALERFARTPLPGRPALAGRWELMPEKPVERFVLAPLPREIQILVQQFPQLAATFGAVGIGRVTDVARLRTVALTLPSLTAAAGIIPPVVEAGTLIRPMAVPLEELPAVAKLQVPAEALFATTGGGTIDLAVTLSITDQGAITKTMRTVSGTRLTLVVKPSQPARGVRGLVVFKSRGVKPDLPKAFHDRAHLARLRELLTGRPALAQTPPPRLVQREDWLVLAEFAYADPDGDGLYTADIETPVVEGEYEIITLIDYADPVLGTKEIRLISVIDPEGYVYERFGDREARIPGAIVTLHWLDPETKTYGNWPAVQFQQENPQVTDATGKYAFLVPAGTYALEVAAPGYLTFTGKPFSVREGSGVHLNLELKTRYWYLQVVDWKTVLLGLTLLLLLYNFYRDKRRERQSRR